MKELLKYPQVIKSKKKEIKKFCNLKTIYLCRKILKINSNYQVFQVQPEYVQLNPAFRDYTERSERVDQVLRKWKEGGKFVTLRGWREEYYDVRTQFNTPPLFKMDRSATCKHLMYNIGILFLSCF